jgi:signal transduction histidine kinase
MPAELQPLAGAFNALMERLEAAFAAQERFVADAAHELRSPVAALRLQFGLLVVTQDGADRHDAERDMRQALDRMQRLVEQLLQLSRFGSGPAIAHQRELDLARLAQDVVVDHASAATLRGIDLGAEAPTSVVACGDELQLTTLLNNLVRNALNYCPPGSRVDVVATRGDDGRAILRVVDDGPGIPPAEIERVLDRFVRGAGDHVRTGDPAGSGLGLAIVKAIAERHGATLSLSPGPQNRGLDVTVAFGRSPPASAPGSAVPPPGP